jgi:hypothetical protein
MMENQEIGKFPEEVDEDQETTFFISLEDHQRRCCKRPRGDPRYNDVISLSITKDMKKEIKRLVKEGKYKSQSDLVRKGIKMIFESEDKSENQA